MRSGVNINLGGAASNPKGQNVLLEKWINLVTEIINVKSTLIVYTAVIHYILQFKNNKTIFTTNHYNQRGETTRHLEQIDLTHA